MVIGTFLAGHMVQVVNGVQSGLSGRVIEVGTIENEHAGLLLVQFPDCVEWWEVERLMPVPIFQEGDIAGWAGCLVRIDSVFTDTVTGWPYYRIVGFGFVLCPPFGFSWAGEYQLTHVSL